jgi:hypothetical protein
MRFLPILGKNWRFSQKLAVVLAKKTPIFSPNFWAKTILKS